MEKLKFKKLHDNAVIPMYATPGAAGMDLVAIEDGSVSLSSVKLVKTGLSVAVPKGYEMQIRPRSGLAFKHGITVLNSPGTIDSDYRGEIGVLLHNTDPDVSFYFKAGDRIAQAVICPVAQPYIEVVDELDETERGAGGFGSTGVASKS